MKNLFIYFLLVFALPLRMLSQPVTVGNGGTEYLNLAEAFNDINAGNLTGDIVLQIIDNCTQSTTAILYPTGYNGNSDYTSITIYPIGSGYIIGGNINGPLIELNGAANVLIDGRVNQSGPANLIITNTNTGSSSSTIRFAESANNNVVQYCRIKGSETGSASGVLFFSTASVGSGNDNILIENNEITSDAAGRPVNAIYSSGTSGSENSGNTINSNKLYDFLNDGLTSNGIFLDVFTSGWIITGNSFYETASFAPTASVTYNALQINNTGTGFTITGNYFGGSDVSCGGSAWTKSNEFDNPFFGLNLSTGTSIATSVQNNTIRNFAWSNSGSASWTGINVLDGTINIGNITANTIGSTTGTGSILVTGALTGTNVFGINIAGNGTIDCRQNIVGSITAANADANASNIFGINISSGSGTFTISNNTVGSTTQANSINASSGSTGANAQVIMGINNNATGTVIISNNTIANLKNSTTNTGITRRGLINGISSTNGTNTITNNIIRDLTIANGNTAATYQASVCGIALTGITYSKTISHNTIYNLSNTYASFGGSVIGIFHTGTTSSSNSISENFIHSLSVASSSASIYGIKINSGTSVYSNNIISLGGNTATTIYGIYETGIAGNNNNLYFNSVYISGTPASGARNSYALYSAVITNNRDFRNNILYNARSNSGATGLHYAIYILTTGGTITCDYNDYYVSGTGGVLGHYGTDKAVLPVVTGQDANSFALDPVYTVAGSTNASDYTIGVDMIGVSGTGITTDFGGATRNNPTIGAWERIVNKWKGTTGTAWNVSGNWTANAVPLENSNIIFDAAPTNNLYLNADHSVNNITISTANRLVTNGKQLTIKGILTLTNGGQIDATTTSSALIYAGTVAQTIDGNNFVNGKTYNLIIDNTPGVTINTDFTVDNNLTINSGKLLSVSAGSLLTVTGTLTNNAGNGGLILRSTANGVDGKLLNNTVSVPGTVELSLAGGAGGSGPAFHYIVPPVVSMTIGTTVANVLTNLGLTNFNGDLLSYSETAAGSNKDNGWQYFDGYNSTTPFSTITSANGYNIYLTANDKITFSGTLNGAAHTYSNLSYTNLGWNLVGNPYPCNYNLTGISELMGIGDNVDNTVVFNHDGGYAYWNVETGAGTTGFSAIMPPMQGFFVHVTASGKSLNLPVSFKSAVAALPTRSKGSYESNSKGSDPVKKIKLVLNNGSTSDETIVCLIENATNGYDGDYDAYKFFGGSASPYIYTNLSSLKYAINSVSPPDVFSSVTIPVNLELKTSGTYSIDITEFENLGGIPVILKHGAIETTLSKDVSYTFSSGAGTYTDFELIIGQTGSITKVEPVLSGIFKVWYSNNFMYINCPADIPVEQSNIVIYDLQGKQVYSVDPVYLMPGQTIQQSVNLPKGIYIMKINLKGHQPVVSKIVVI